jgi:hypothetical protein
MPHFKCVACKTRLHTAARPPDWVGDFCPQCGSLLEPVGELAEVVGFRLIEPLESALGIDSPETRQQMSDRLDEFLARREVRLAQARLDAWRWVDDGGSLSAEAVALPRPETNR